MMQTARVYDYSEYPPDYDRATAEAERILAENYITYPPVLPQKIASNYGLAVRYAPFPDAEWRVSGFLDFGERTIYVNESDSHHRQLFTIAHELGHWILHKPIYDASPDQYAVLQRIPLGKPDIDPLEKEANVFAATLLVPKYLLDEVCSKNYKPSTPSLSFIFDVSQDVIGFRLAHLYPQQP